MTTRIPCWKGKFRIFFAAALILLTLMLITACNVVDPPAGSTDNNALESIPLETDPPATVATAPVASEVTEPTPSDPLPTEPPPTETIPTVPAPTETISTEPAPTEPIPSDLPPTIPAPTEPLPSDPAPTDPPPQVTEPADPPATEPEPTEPIEPILSNFTIVSDWRVSNLAKKLAESIKNAYHVTVAVSTKNAFQGGPAIYIGLEEINSYGGYRFGISADVEKQAIYINGSGNSLAAGCEYLVAKNLLSGEFPFAVTENIYGYAWNSADIERTDYGNELMESKTRSPAPGVIIHELQYNSQELGITKAYAIVVKKNANAEVKAVATGWDSSHNADNPAPLCTVKEFSDQLMEKGDKVLAITNASFFYLGTTNLPSGMQIIDGVVRQEPSDIAPRYSDNWFGVTYDGKYIIADYKVYNSDYKGKNLLKYAVGGGEIIMSNSVPLSKSMEPDFRTAVAINAAGDMVLLTVENANYAMIQRVMMDLDLDITTILNLDGGGSTTLYAVDPHGELERVQGKTAEDRAVSDALAIIIPN